MVCRSSAAHDGNARFDLRNAGGHKCLGEKQFLLAPEHHARRLLAVAQGGVHQPNGMLARKPHGLLASPIRITKIADWSEPKALSNRRWAAHLTQRCE